MPIEPVRPAPPRKQGTYQVTRFFRARTRPRRPPVLPAPHGRLVIPAGRVAGNLLDLVGEGVGALVVSAIALVAAVRGGVADRVVAVTDPRTRP